MVLLPWLSLRTFTACKFRLLGRILLPKAVELRPLAPAVRGALRRVEVSPDGGSNARLLGSASVSPLVIARGYSSVSFSHFRRSLLAFWSPAGAEVSLDRSYYAPYFYLKACSSSKGTAKLLN